MGDEIEKRKKKLILVVYTILWSLWMIYIINTYFYLVEHFDKDEYIQTYSLILVVGMVVIGVFMGVVLMKSLDDLGKERKKEK